MFEYNGFEITWEGHASVRIKDNDFILSVDPYQKVSGNYKADIVLLTHSDAGHFDKDKIEGISKPGTCVVAPKSLKDKNIPCKDVEYIDEGEQIDIFGVVIEGIPMYNEEHERGEGLGYRFVMGEYSFYIAGDTGLIEEMRDLENKIDIAFLPIDGKYTMSEEDAVKAGVRIKPEILIPYHYGKPFFKDKNPLELVEKSEDRNIKTKIIEPEYKNK